MFLLPATQSNLVKEFNEIRFNEEIRFHKFFVTSCYVFFSPGFLESPTNATGEGAAGEMVIDSAASKFRQSTVIV